MSQADLNRRRHADKRLFKVVGLLCLLLRDRYSARHELGAFLWVERLLLRIGITQGIEWLVGAQVILVRGAERME